LFRILSLHGNPQVIRAIEPSFGQKETIHVKVSHICDLNPHEALVIYYTSAHLMIALYSSHPYVTNTIFYTLYFSGVNQGNSYTVNIAIKDLVPGEAWWYIACSTYKRGAGREGSTYKCSRCSTNAVETRYSCQLKAFNSLR
jgi:hypothetical protein